jgi:hypothetical protein
MTIKRFAILITAFALAVGALPASACGVPMEEFGWESVAAALAECGVICLGGGVAFATTYGRENDAGTALACVLLVSYPFAAACGAYCAGEGFTPSENKSAVFGTTFLAAYGQTFALAGIAGVVYKLTDIDSGDVIKTAAATDIFTKPVFVTFVYNAKKKAAARPQSRGPALEPYVDIATASDGTAVPLYGLTFSF